MKWLLVWIIVWATTAGNVLQALGMRDHGEIHDFRPGALGRVASALMRSRYIVASVVAMAVSFFETILAKYLLKERVGWKRWAGVALVACGVGLLSI